MQEDTPQLPSGITKGSIVLVFEHRMIFTQSCNATQWLGPRMSHMPAGNDIAPGLRWV